MKRRCEDFLEGLVSLAFGNPEPSAEAHAAECHPCARRLAELREIARAASVRSYDAPRELVERTKAISLPQPRRIFARLLGSSLAGSGARFSGGEGVQALFEAEGERVRVLATPGPEAWRVAGSVGGEGWSVEVDGELVSLSEQGRFAFDAAGPASTGFRLIRPGVVVEVPSVEEMREGGAGSAR